MHAQQPGGTASAPAAAGRRGRNVHLVCVLGVALLHFLWVTAHLAPAIMSPDANGYVVQARLIADQGRTSFSTDSPAQFVGMHWLETRDGVFHSRYPAGLPVLLAAAWKVGGLHAALFVNPLLASATVLLVFFVARRLMSANYALAAAVVVALLPTTNQHALDADAHVAAAFFLVAGVLAVLRFATDRSPAFGLVGGVLLGIVPTIRYPEAVVGLPIAAWLLTCVRPIARNWAPAAGALVPLIGLVLHNAGAYGAFWRTGYALTNEQTGFGVSYFAAHVLPYLQALSGPGLALMFGFGVAGLAALIADPRQRVHGWLFAGVTVPLVVLYMAYYFGGGPGGAGSLRFLVPTFPFLIIAGVWLLASFAERVPVSGRAAVATALGLQVLVGFGGSAEVLARGKTSLGAAARARALAEREIPAGSVVIVDRQLAESLDATGRWKLVEENLVSGDPPNPPRPGGRGGPGGVLAPRPLGMPANASAPSPQQRGKNRAQLERYAGLAPEERRELAWSDLRAWANGRPIFWFARSVDAVGAALPDDAQYFNVAEVEAPMMFGPGGSGAPPAGGISASGARGSRGPIGPGISGGNAGRPARGPGGFPPRGGFAGSPTQRLSVIQITWRKS